MSDTQPRPTGDLVGGFESDDQMTVKYWRGTTRLEGKATTYRGALRLASHNQNAYPPRYYDNRGVELHDTGYGLAYEEPDEKGRIVCVV